MHKKYQKNAKKIKKIEEKLNIRENRKKQKIEKPKCEKTK